MLHGSRCRIALTFVAVERTFVVGDGEMAIATTPDVFTVIRHQDLGMWCQHEVLCTSVGSR